MLMLMLALSLVFAPAAQTTPAVTVPSRPEVLPLSQEIDLALSAAPDHLKAGAGVWALEAGGFVKIRDTTNHFTCIVNRDHPLNRKPTCYDAEGTATILPKVVFIGTEMMKGRSLKDIAQDVRDGFASGKFVSPRRPGVAYMLSHEIRNYNPQTGQVDGFPPHVMFYAPNLTAEDIGSVGMSQEGLPFIGYQGPQGFMIVVVPEYAHASTVKK